MAEEEKTNRNVARKKTGQRGAHKKANSREIRRVTNTLKENFSHIAELSGLIPIGSEKGFELVASTKKLARYVNYVADTVAASENVSAERLESLSVVTARISRLVTSLDTVLLLRSDTLRAGANEVDVFNDLMNLPEETVLKIASLGVPLRQLPLSEVLALNVPATIAFGPFTELLELIKAILKEIKAALVIALVICIFIAPELIPIIIEALATLLAIDQILDLVPTSPGEGGTVTSPPEGPSVTEDPEPLIYNCGDVVPVVGTGVGPGKAEAQLAAFRDGERQAKGACPNICPPTFIGQSMNPRFNKTPDGQWRCRHALKFKCTR